MEKESKKGPTILWKTIIKLKKGPSKVFSPLRDRGKKEHQSSDQMPLSKKEDSLHV